MSCLLIEPWDFTQSLYGNGSKAVVDSAIRNLGVKLKLVGVTSKGDVGRWTKVSYYGQQLDFLPVISADRIRKPRWLAANVHFAAALARHLPQVRAARLPAVLTRTYSVLWLLTLRAHNWDICFYYPGLANPLSISKRAFMGKTLAPLYEIIQARSINKATVAFAPASRDVVAQYNRRLRRFGVRKEVLYLPTAVDLELFRPRPMNACRRTLGLPEEVPIFTFVGRLASVKGIPLLLEALKCVHQWNSSAMLLLVGDGESRGELESLVSRANLQERVRFLGQCPPATVATAIGSANACVVGSIAEGFSNSMVEQIACGRPIVSTPVSGADELILEGRNGFIVLSRDPGEFAERMVQALDLREAEAVSRQLAEERHSDKRLWERVMNEWPALR